MVAAEVRKLAERSQEAAKLSKATQQNVSASEELAATSEELSGQAKQLQDSIAFFNVGDRNPSATDRRLSSPQRPSAPPRLKSAVTTAAVRSVRSRNFQPY